MLIFIYSRKSVFTGKGESIQNQVEMCKSTTTLNATSKADKHLELLSIPVDLERYQPTYVGDKLKEYRKQKGLSQKQLAQILHISEFTLRSWEQKVTPGYEKFKLIRKLLDL